MGLIFFAALCSVVVSILLRIAREKGYSPLEMITWNYMAASILCFLWFKPDIAHISVLHTPWWLIVVLGILLPSVFLFLAKSLQSAGVLKTEIAQRLSVILSLSAAYFIFNESFNEYKWLGVVLGLIAVFFILISHRNTDTSFKQGMGYLALVWLGYALIDVLLKYTTGLGLQFAVALNLVFMAAFILSLGYIKLKYKSFGQSKNIIAGLFLGLLNFANIALYVKAHMILKDSPAVVFAGMNILVVVFGVLSGVIFFKEKLQLSSILGLVLGLASVACLAYSMLV
jgi:drug/metabolite transporter (DMT)-like permease